MTAPISKQVEVDDLRALLDHARDCADELRVAIASLLPSDDPVSARVRARRLAAADWLAENLPVLAVKYRMGDR